ncbi:MAG: thiamine phosphate synthase [Acidimicrobiia bacterium]|nr:thiamine phosphate synthase [Acidimicrobiia bacterium]
MTAPPPLVVLTDGEATARAGHDLREVLASAVDGGLRAVVVRERHLAPALRLALVRFVEDLLGPLGGLVMVATPPLEDHHNVHLTASSPVPRAKPLVMGRSCHDGGELARAAAEGCDYATLSPIFPTTSKAGYGPALGTGPLARPPLPVYALGGVTPANAPACLAAGASGVAVMGAVMRAGDPATVVSSVLSAVGAS